MERLHIYKSLSLMENMQADTHNLTVTPAYNKPGVTGKVTRNRWLFKIRTVPGK